MARVLSRLETAPAVFEIEVEREELAYQVGDCALLIRGRGIDSRPYSFSSHPDEQVLRFLVRRIEAEGPDRSFSRWVTSLEPGDEVGVGTPFGWFRPGRTDQEVWFATGTGISPFLAALRAGSPVRPRGFYIGVRGPHDASFRQWLNARAPVRWAFSRPDCGEEPPRRVTDFTDEVSVAPEIGYFLCGNQKMIRDVSGRLKTRGVAPSQIHEELFFQ